MADTLTLQQLSDLVFTTQGELDDLRVLISDHDTRITTNTNDITTLENPPAAVPPGLLSWFVAGHTITESDAILDTSISTINANVTQNTTDITDLQTSIANEITDRTTADSTLQSQIDTHTSDISTLNTNLTQEISDRGSLSSSVATQYDLVNTRIDNLAADLATLSTDSNTDSTSLYTSVSTINASLQTIQTQIQQLQNIGVDPLGAQASQITALTVIANDAAADVAQEILDRQSADASLQASILASSASLSNFSTDLTNETNARVSADNSINTQIGTINTTLSGHTASISSETSARIAADTALQTSVDTNTADITTNANNIAQEIIDRVAADTDLQTQVTTNTGQVATNTADIDTLNSQAAVLNAKFGVVKDGSGYVTSWQILDSSTAAGSFNLRNLNNDTRLQNPGYAGKYFPPVAAASFAPATIYDTQYGAGPLTDFQGTDTNNYSRNVNVYATASVGINGSVFMGVDYSTGGNLNRLGQVLTTFVVNFGGFTNSQLSLWYRIKATPTDTTQRWYPVAMATVSNPSAATYEHTSKRAVIQISVTANQVIEFGITNVSTLDASRSTSNTMIYDASVSVEALNMVTVS